MQTTIVLCLISVEINGFRVSFCISFLGYIILSLGQRMWTLLKTFNLLQVQNEYSLYDDRQPSDHSLTVVTL